jgi:hypothetical protein
VKRLSAPDGIPSKSSSPCLAVKIKTDLTIYYSKKKSIKQLIKSLKEPIFMILFLQAQTICKKVAKTRQKSQNCVHLTRLKGK